MIEMLKPCPFCGSELVNIAVEEEIKNSAAGEYYAVGHCKMCDAKGKRIRISVDHSIGETRERAFQLAFEAWNLRGGKC